MMSSETVFYPCSGNLGFQLVSLDGCNYICIILGETPSTYLEARDACADFQGGRLVVADTIEKLIQIWELFQTEMWVGLQDMDVENEFLWSDGRYATSQEINTLFTPGEPNNAGGNEDCISVRHQNPWLNDSPCQTRKLFVCEQYLLS